MKIERMGDPVLGPIGLVAPNLDVAMTAEGRDQVIGIAAVAIMQDADIEMARHPLVHWREAVDGNEDLVAAAPMSAVEQSGNGGMEGLIDRRCPCRPLLG